MNQINFRSKKKRKYSQTCVQRPLSGKALLNWKIFLIKLTKIIAIKRLNDYNEMIKTERRALLSGPHFCGHYWQENVFQKWL